MDSEPKTSTDDDTEGVAKAEADLAAVQAAQTDQPPARARVAPPSESPGRPPPSESPGRPGAAGGTSDAGGAPQPQRGGLGRELDVLGARVEGMAVTMRDMARVALAAALLAVIALLVSLYVLRLIRGYTAP